MKETIRRNVAMVAEALASYPFEDQQAYAFWLSQAYYFVVHSTPMLALSAALGAANRDYHIRCIEHLSEEKGHDKMLLNDLKAMGHKPSDFPELAETSALYQTQYYWIEHKSPTSFIGYIMLLEGLAVVAGKNILSRVNKHRGKSFILVHADDDVEHLEKAMKMMDSFSESEQRLIADNCELASNLYLTMLSSMSKQTKTSLKSA